mgnify:CR=1 FL=1
MTITNIDSLVQIREKHKNEKIVFCSGSFDLTHLGHVLFFDYCKKYGDILVVAVGKDISINRDKVGGRPILNEKIRLRMIDSLKPVDYAFINPTYSTEKKLLTIELAFEKLKPDVYVIREDASNIPYRRKLSDEYNVNMIILKREDFGEFKDISTTSLIEKIKNL